MTGRLSDQPTAASRVASVPEDLLRGFLNGHEAFRVVLIASILGLFGLAGAHTTWRSDFVICIYCIVGSMAITRLRRWTWVWKQAKWSYFFDRVPVRWLARTGTRLRYPLVPLIVDSAAIAYLVFRTGGAASVFIVWFPSLAATGDLVLYDPRHHRVFGVVLSLLFLGSTLAAMLQLSPIHSELRTFIGAPGTINRSVYLGIVALQWVLIGLLGHVMHRVGRGYIDAVRRNGNGTEH